MIQDREHTGFQDNTTHLSGRGPTLLETRRKRRKAEEVFIQQCKENIAKGIIDKDIPNDQEEIFIPNKRARHRVPKHSLQQIQHKRNKVNQMFRKQIITQIKQQRIKVNKRNRKIKVKIKLVT